MTISRSEWRVTVWAEWVMQAVTREARAERLAQVPAVMRDTVRQEVVWYFKRQRLRTRSLSGYSARTDNERE